MSSPEGVAGHRDQIDDIEHAAARAAVRPRSHNGLTSRQPVGGQVDEAAGQQRNYHQVGAQGSSNHYLSGVQIAALSTRRK
ncbi:MAG TPA: hypothetical protein VNP53_03830, partial [Methylomirabilota bacterium]|nr:hypothetical protein [Methylomirabilota bacterium]